MSKEYLKELYQMIKDKKISPAEAAAKMRRIKANGNQEGGSLEEKATFYLKNLLSSELKVPVNHIDAEIPMEEYGIDSVMIMQMTSRLEEVFGPLSKTLFFEYQTIKELTGYFLKEYSQDLINLLEISGTNVKKSTSKNDIIQFLKSLLSSELKVEANKIDEDVLMEEYGIDSVMVMQMTSKLEEGFGTLSKTLFFEYKTINELAEYFMKEHSQKLAELLGPEADEEVVVKRSSDTAEKPVLKVPAERVQPDKKSRVLKEKNTIRKPDSFRSESCEIAVIGLAGKYPKADSIYEYWENLQNGVDCITEIPKERWDYSGYYDSDRNKTGKINSKWGGFINDIYAFDPLFFHISPKEAEIMEPQERLFLECAYAAFEDAGYTRETYDNRNRTGIENNIGVFVGALFEEYQLYGAEEQIKGNMIALNGNLSSIANRVSYHLNLHGPSLAVDTLCSSSLTAVHLACQSIQRGECEMAIAGGVNVSVHPNKYLLLSQNNFLSGNGRCNSFGEGGDGYVPGEGVGAILLKPLDRAVEDHDHIYALVKSSAINHGGKTNGYTVPNPVFQAEVIREAYKKADINPRTIGYIEAHGTGTTLGDPIEIHGLQKVFGEYTEDKQFCKIGSVKSNIGHCESAAGIAGITKILLQMQYGKLVPSLHSKTLNSNINFQDTAFRVQQELEPWNRPVISIDGKKEEYPRRAGISSFGAGGSNAHIVLEEYRKPGFNSEIKLSKQIFVLSAKDTERLKANAARYLTFIDHIRDTDRDSVLFFHDMAYTMQVGREPMEERAAFVAADLTEFTQKLADFIEGKEYIPGVYTGNAMSIKSKEVFQGTAGQEFTKMLIVSKEYTKVAELWAMGVRIDWTLLYELSESCYPSRISLPTYLFDNKEYLAIKSEGSHGKPEKYEKEEKKEENFLYTAVWEQEDSTEPICYKEESTGKTLCFYSSESREVTDGFLPFLTGKNVIRVELGSTWKRLSAGEYMVDCTAIDTFGPLLEDVKQVDVIYYFAGIQRTKFDTEDMELFETVQNRGVHCLFKLMKALGMNGYEYRKIIFKLITNNTYRILPEDECSPYSAAAYGLARCADKEFPDWHISGIDIHLTGRDTGDGLKEEFDFILNEKESISHSDVAIRNGRRYVKKIYPLDLEKEGFEQFKEGGTYFIVGGAGGIGFQLSLYLAEKVHGNIILAGRRQLNPEIEEKINKIEERGGKGLYIQADVTDYKSIRKAVEKAKERFGQLNGIIHSALVLQDQLIINMDEQKFKMAVEPKSIGCVALHNAVKNENVDFILYFSSAESFAGSAGQGNYAAGCAFSDAFAQYESNCGYPSKIINWGYWGEVGVAANDEYRKRFAAAGIYPIRTAEGIDAIEKILAADHVQVLAMKVSPEVLTSMGAGVTQAENAEDLTESVILDSIAEVLKIDKTELDMDVPYNEYGVDSILAGQIIYKINNSLGVELSSTALFNYPTALRLKEFIVSEYKNLIQERTRQRMPESGRAQLPEKDADCEGKRIDIKADSNQMDIAIVGISGRFPGAENLDEYWENLSNGIDSVKEIDRWENDDYFSTDEDAINKSYINVSGLLDDVETFDPLFFNISPREAEVMDPKQRVFLEEAWKALEDAGFSDRELNECKCGVFAGSSEGDYMRLIDQCETEKSNYVLTGNLLPILSARISYLLNLRGPSIVVSTACSSSLVAVHQACLSILAGDSDIALAGGVNVFSTPDWHVLGSSMGMFSHTGRCRPFDDKADGFIPAEGVGVAVLKKLDKAIEDGDHIYGVIAASGLNQDGKSNGITAPNGQSQVDLVTDVYNKYHINPEDISYIEAHGTGTRLGDPIEIEALSQTYRKFTDKKQFCPIGSVKANIGHALEAAGIAGIIKVLLCMKHGKLVPDINFDTENTLIPFKNSPVFVNTEYKDWNTLHGKPRMAAISSFGISGTNAHLVLKEYEAEQEEYESKEPKFIAFSAKTKENLYMKIAEMLHWLKENKGQNSLDNIAYTLLAGRSHFSYRMAYIIDSPQQLIDEMEQTMNHIPAADAIVGEYVSNAFKPDRAVVDKAEKIMDELKEGNGSVDDFREKLKYLGVLYTEGYDLMWKRMFHSSRYRKLSLPTYPFTKERYWVDDGKDNSTFARTSVSEGHAYSMQNRSTLTEQRYSTVFDVKQPFVRDHIVNNEMVLPGAVYIEMARAAAGMATEQEINLIEDIVWEKPIVVHGDKEVNLTLKSVDNKVAFEVYTADSAERYVHAQGTASHVERNELAFEYAKALDIEKVKARCCDIKKSNWCYRIFKSMGLDYGNQFQVIQELYSNAGEALAYLTIPAAKDTDSAKYVLHPSILDGAFQMVLGLTGEEALNSQKAYVPFFIEKIKILKPLENTCLAYATKKQKKGNTNTLCFSIQITDLDGNLLVIIDGYNLRVYQKQEDEMLEMLKMLENGEIMADEAERFMEVIYD